MYMKNFRSKLKSYKETKVKMKMPIYFKIEKFGLLKFQYIANVEKWFLSENLEKL